MEESYYYLNIKILMMMMCFEGEGVGKKEAREGNGRHHTLVIIGSHSMWLRN